MKRLLLACALIPCIAIADSGFNQNGLRTVVRDGHYTFEYDRTRDISGLSHTLRGSQFHGNTTLPAVVVGSNGAQSAGDIPATYRVVTDKRKVFASLLQKARAAGPAILKGGKALGSLTLRTGWQFLVWQLVSSAISGSKFSWNDDRNDFVRPADDNTYIVIATKNSHTVVSGSNKTSLEVENLCKYNLNNECEVLDYAKGRESANAVANAYCQSKTFVIDGKTQHFERTDWGGHCYSGRYQRMSMDYGVVIFKYVDYVPMTLDEFIEEGTPEAAASPTEWVKTSEVQPDGEPKILITDGTVAQSRPYTDPADGKAKQSKWTFNSDGSVKEVITDRPDLTPDSPQAPKLDPNAVPDNKTDNPDKKTQPASQPAPIDLCKEHPEILACQELGEPDPSDFDIKIPEKVDDTTWKPDNFLPSDGVCPQPKIFHVLGKPFSVSYEPLCEIMRRARFIILIAFTLMSAYIVFGSLTGAKK